MIDVETPKYSPHEIGMLTGIHPDRLRDWRRQGLLMMIGSETEGGHWKYSVLDMVALWLSERLCGNGSGVSRTDAIHNSSAYANDVAIHMVQRHKHLNPTGKRYAGQIWEGFTSNGIAHGWTIVRVTTLSEMDEMTFDRAEIIDIWHIAETAPRNIQMEVMAAFGE